MFKRCSVCQDNFRVKPSHQQKRITCSKTCQAVHLSGKMAGSGNPAFGKTYKTKITDPDWAKRISETSKGTRTGDENPMRREEVRKKASLSRKRLMEDPAVRKLFSEKTKRAWEDGKFQNVAVGRCRWYEHKKNDGGIVKLQGSWELAFAEWLDSKEMAYSAHHGRIAYVDVDGASRNYYPDFFVEEWDSWVEIKNDYHFRLQQGKLECIMRSNPGLALRVLKKMDLAGLGIELGGRR